MGEMYDTTRGARLVAHTDMTGRDGAPIRLDGTDHAERAIDAPAKAATDPVGALIDAVAETILEYRRHAGTGYRLTSDELTARELATEIVDLVWDWEPPS